MAAPRTILITGASRGLGAALADLYARRGNTLHLTARSLEALASIKRQLESQGVKAHCHVLELADESAIRSLINQIEQSQSLDLVIANAGIFSGHASDGQMETAEQQDRQIQVNLMGAMSIATHAARYMQKRGSGHIALISSLAALQPQPDSPAYTASKAGLSAYGDALRDYLAEDGVKITTILPGHIESDQTAIHQGALPGLLSAEKAATIIAKGLDRGKARIMFPRHLYWLILLNRLLPAPIRRWANKPFRYSVKRPEEQESTDA